MSWRRLRHSAGRNWRRVGDGIETNVLPRIVSRRMRANVAMFHCGRSGSTVLADMLKPHRDVYWHGETYTLLMQEWERNHGPFRVGDGRFSFDPIAAVQYRLAHTWRPVFGFEIKPYHFHFSTTGAEGVDLERYVEQLARLGFEHFILLERENLLRVVVSSAIGARTGLYQRRPSDPAARQRIRLDLDRIDSQHQIRSIRTILDDHSRDRERLRKILAPRNTLTLVYESDVEPEPRIGYQRICEFIGIPAQSLRPPLARVNPDPLCDIVVNFGELREALDGTPYEWMSKE